jgi:hypothetical protein
LRRWADIACDFFSTMIHGEFDFAALVKEPGPMVEPLRDVVYFKRAFLEHGAPT